MANTVLLQIRNLTKSFGPKKIFDEANVSFGEKQKIGVIGPNGAGKTTFFKILMRQEMPDSGEILWMPNLRLGYIEQHDAFEPNETVINFLQRYTGKPEWECAKVASQFQLKGEKLKGKITDLSGGWQMRVKLTATLLFDPNLLLLDEPTNYLDLSTLMLLENFLLTFKGTVLVITHDREFIKKTCTSILDVEHGQLFLHHEPLEKYLEFKEERQNLADSVNVNIERKQKQLQTFVDRFGSKASMAKSAQSKLKQIEKLDEEKLETVAKSATVRMHIPPIETRDGVALECKNLTIGYDGKNEKGFKTEKVEEKVEIIENTKPRVLFATTNNHKIRLFKLAWENQKLDAKFDLVTLNDLPKIKVEHIEENSDSFTGDALIKAKIYAKTYNLPTISQDCGFIFNALNWPGMDSKKVMFGDDKKIYSKENWQEERQDNLARAMQVLSKIDGLDRKMQIIQGLAIALPSGEFAVEEKITLGIASEKVVDKIGGAFDWFFVAQGQNRINSQFESQEELDQFSAINLYPITPKIINLLEKKLSQNSLDTVGKNCIDATLENIKLGKTIHLIGLFSDSDKYSRLEDWAKMIELANEKSVEKIVLHLIAGGIDTDKKLAEIWEYFIQKYEEILKPMENKIYLGSLNSQEFANSQNLQKIIFSLISVLDYRLGTNIDQEKKLNFIQKCNKFLREKYGFETETLNDLECYFYDLENNFADITKVLERWENSDKLPKMIVPNTTIKKEIIQIRNHLEVKNTICFINKLDRFTKILSEINTEFDINLDILDLENENLENQTLTKNQSQNSKPKTKIIASNINLDVNRGLKVAILGDNGQGKSTLLKTLADELLPLGGVCEFKNGLKVAYYHQHVAANLDPHETVFDYIKRGGHKEEVIYRVLSNFLFKKTDYLKKIEVLSGGEKARLCLAGMFLSKADVYLLDEPTNHLDFETVEAMGRALGEFNGTVFVISHNRTFVSLIASEIWEVNAGQVKRVLGTYTDYLWSKEEQIRQEMRFGEKYPVSSAATPSLRSTHFSEEKYTLEKGNSETPSSQNKKFADLSTKEKAKKLYETRKEIGKVEKKIKNIQELINQNEMENKIEHAEKNQAILSDLEIIYLELLEDLDGLI